MVAWLWGLGVVATALASAASASSPRATLCAQARTGIESLQANFYDPATVHARKSQLRPGRPWSCARAHT